jgi:DNA polymerase I-like protein with 3'-5' exonuclease and polymerase domains
MAYQTPLFMPESSWRMPDDFPNLGAAKRIAVDTETKDPNLSTMGPGFVRGDAKVVGVSICTDDRQVCRYYPVGHLEGPNLPRNAVFGWLKEELGRPNQEKVFANALYDLEGLWSEGVEVAGKIHDVQTAEPLLNEESHEGYSLDVLSNKYLGEGKDEELIEAGAWAFRDGKRDKKWLKNSKSKLHIYPANLVGPYAEIDALRTLEVFDKQWPLLQAEELERVYDVETRLIRLLLQMRLKGVKFDLDAADVKSREWRSRERVILDKLLNMVGFPVDPWSPGDMSKLFNYYGVPINRTEKGAASFENDAMAQIGVPSEFAKQDFEERADKCAFPGIQLSVAFRKLNKMRRDFVDGYPKLCHKGRIHAEFRALKRDEDGTRSGRFSSSHPNLQQVPHRDPIYAPQIRELFVPDEGLIWTKRDFSQQEPRLTIHYAYLRKMPGAYEAWKQFRDDPFTDYHQMTADMAGVTRKQAKAINLGLAYGMGKKKLAAQLGLTLAEAEPLFKLYHERLPYMRLLAAECEAYAQKRGYIRTILGRRRHFDLWEPDVPFEAGSYNKAYPLEKARRVYPEVRLKRAHARKAMNALIQGGGADVTKMAMLIEFEEYGEVPYCQVHDELDNGVESVERALVLKHSMENAIEEITVPMVADLEYGDNWGNLELYKMAA